MLCFGCAATFSLSRAYVYAVDEISQQHDPVVLNCKAISSTDAGCCPGTRGIPGIEMEVDGLAGGGVTSPILEKALTGTGKLHAEPEPLIKDVA